MESQFYEKKLCMTEMRIGHIRCPEPTECEQSEIGNDPCFVFMVHGEIAITSMGRQVRASAGDLLFIPEGVRYHSVWTGTPDIESYRIHIISKKLDLADTAGIYTIQRVAEMSNETTGARIREIFELFRAGDRVSKLRAIGLYYLLYAEIVPHLKREMPQKFNHILGEALDFIGNRYSEDFSMEELAAHCCVSQSQLFRLFRSELGTTPVRYRNRLRVERAALELRISEDSIDAIAGRHGFHSAAYFRETFKLTTGLTPTEYRAMAQGN